MVMKIEMSSLKLLIECGWHFNSIFYRNFGCTESVADRKSQYSTFYVERRRATEKPTIKEELRYCGDDVPLLNYKEKL